MLIDIGSDLHIDINYQFGDFDFEANKHEGSEVLVLAGDLANNPEFAIYLLEEAAKVYPQVVFVDGNHEHYSSKKLNMSVAETMELFRLLAKRIGNLYYLDGKTTFRHREILFVGANAWYDFNYAPSQYPRQFVHNTWMSEMNDSQCIIFDKPPEVYAEEQANEILQNVVMAQLNRRIKQIVVVTHTLSNRRGLVYKNNPTWDMLNGAYGNKHMEKVFAADDAKKIVLAICGHTHYQYDFKDGHVRWVVNPRGYHGVDRDVSRWFLVQVDTDEKVLY